MIGTPWTDEDWKLLQSRIAAGNVTPVLGAGASAGVVGTSVEVAKAWATCIDYPFPDSDSLPAVAQYVATMIDRARPGEYINERLTACLQNLVVADLADRHDPYRSLPRYPFRVWLTTNYDDLIKRALNAYNKPPRIGVAQWTPADLYWDKAQYDLSDFAPDPKRPLVFHLHGWFGDPKSMVITEADYLEYLEQMSGMTPVLPPMVTEAIATTSLLFIGYNFRDVNLQLVLRQWRIPKVAFVVRPPPEGLSASAEKYASYYPQYLKKVTGVDCKVYWGRASEFCAELDERLGGGG